MPTYAQFPAYPGVKTLWTQKDIYDLILAESPILGILRKDTTLNEEVRKVVVGYGAGQGIGASFATAKANASSSPGVTFNVSAKSYYFTGSIDGRLIRSWKNGGSSAMVLDPLKRDTKNLLRQARRDLSRFIHGNGVGNFGVVGSIASNTITLGGTSSKSDIRTFEVGQTLQFVDTTNTTPRAATAGSTIITAVDDSNESALKITIASVAGVTGLVATDLIFRDGVRNLAMDGFDSWCPDYITTPGLISGAYNGVVRNVHPTRLAGQILDGTALDIRQAIFAGARKCYDAGGKPDTVIMSTRNFESLAFKLQSAGSIIHSKAPAAPIGKFNIGVSYDGIEMRGPAGALMVLPDPEMPDTVVRVLDKSTWYIGSVGPLLHWIEDSNPFGSTGDAPGTGGLMQENDADRYEYRGVGDMQLVCEAPGYNCRISVTAP